MVTDYLEGALPTRQRIGAWLHLRQCTACTHYFDQMRRTIGLLRRAPPPAPPPAEDTILRRLADEPPPPAA